jgi:hypothetical protein
VCRQRARTEYFSNDSISGDIEMMNSKVSSPAALAMKRFGRPLVSGSISSLRTLFSGLRKQARCALLPSLALAAFAGLPGTAVAVTVPGASCNVNGLGASCDVVTATVSSRPMPGSFAFSTLTYYVYLESWQNRNVPVHISAALTAFEQLDGSSVLNFNGDYPKYDVFSWFNLGTSAFYNGNPGLVFAGIGAAGTRSGINGTDVGGQFGYTPALYSSRTVSPDGQHVSQITWLNVNTRVQLRTNQFYIVQIGANASNSYNSPSLVSSTYAYADPFFEIDAGFLAENPNAVSLNFSSGVANLPVAQVPEPASVLMLLGGLAALVFRRRAVGVS